MELIDQQFNGGALPDPQDERDYSYEEVMGASEIDWEKGYDIRNELGGDFIPKDQMRSWSCVGQATSQYVWVFQVLEMMKKYGMSLEDLRQKYPEEVQNLSARAIYSQIAIAKGVGAYIRDGALLCIKWGALFEDKLPSYRENGKTDEDFMYDDSWKTPELSELAKILRGKDSRSITTPKIEIFAKAIQENKGLLGGVVGSNGRGWGYAERPEPPKDGDSLWGHALYFGAYGKDGYGKYVAFPNSWGKIVRDTWKPGSLPGTGWQKIYQNYFNFGNVFSPWTYTDKPNEYIDENEFKYKFTKPMWYGQMNNFDVKMMQKVLKRDGCFPVSQVETGNFLNITKESVLKFQLKHQVDTEQELKKLKGEQVGPKTRQALNKISNK